MVAFHASQIEWSDDFGVVVVTLAESGRNGEYLMFQRGKDDESPNDSNIYLERRGQGWAAKGGITSCVLHRNCLLLEVRNETAARLGGGAAFDIAFELTSRRFQSLRSRLERVFRGSNRFTDRSDGERLVRRLPNPFVETIERLFGYWFGHPDPKEGCSYDLIRESEAFMEIRIPSPLREFYLRFGENAVLGTARGLLLTPESLELESDHLVFWMGHEEDRDGAWCGLECLSLGELDPPVERQEFVSDNESIWVPESNRLSEFLLRTMCWQAVWGLPFRAITEATTAAKERIELHLSRVAPTTPLNGESIAYAAEGLAVCVSAEAGVVRIGTRTEDDLFTLERKLSIGLRRA